MRSIYYPRLATSHLPLAGSMGFGDLAAERRRMMEGRVPAVSAAEQRVDEAEIREGSEI